MDAMTRANPIVDADAHVNPSHDMWADYLSEPFREMAPQIEHGEDCDYIVFEGRRRKLNLISAQAGRDGKDFKMHGRAADARAGGWMPKARLDDMDSDGIDTAVLFGGGPLGTTNNELFLASFEAYNRWLADFCAYAPSRFAGVGYVPMQDVDVAIRMMRDFAARGLKAVNIPAFPMAKVDVAGATGLDAQTRALTGDVNGDRSYADPEFDPFWKAACDLGIPVTIHLGGRAVRFTEPKFFLSDLLMSKFGMGEPIAIMIYGGVFQRFPDLRLVSVESGVGWFAFAANYMDETWDKQRHWVNSVLEHAPSYFWERNIFGSFIHDRAGILMRELPGAGNIMWSSDYPHSETTFPHSLAKIEELFAGVPEDEKNMIIGGRAKALFNL
ncbi:hydrolase [Novosphingobium barchaimii LL02]|uniref:Hydrolase n=1 Tax=Novosphingobium barchaimii LL02 TaxID=1114963 RepID=A0A0J7XIR7_9SPHN|nr:amidohydrolase family protein [Novosphingobium barchaimii]KMS51647.1 hydrolase [Novosphingobium barchaimii LL02]